MRCLKEERPLYPAVGVGAAPQQERVPEAGAGVAVAEPAAEIATLTMRAFIDEHFFENFISDDKPRKPRAGRQRGGPRR